MVSSGLNNIASSIRRRLSIGRDGDMESREAVETLPPLKNVPPGNKRVELLRRKCEFCKELGKFGGYSDVEKLFVKNKRKVLLDLVDFMSSTSEAKSKQELLDETAYGFIVDMIKANIFTTQPSIVDSLKEDEDEPYLDVSWPHKQVVYELLLRLVVNGDFSAKMGKREGLIDQSFCAKLIQAFKSDDPRERDYLKTVLHRIYGKFMCHRSFIRKAMGHVFLDTTANRSRRSNGVAELLEILGSIINGFALPLKPEHVLYVENILIPLHKSPRYDSFASQLTYCMIQYIEKDNEKAAVVLTNIVKYWPWATSQKQVGFLNELEEILEVTSSFALRKVERQLFKCLSRCISSEQFQVSERSLFLWNNDQILQLFASDMRDTWFQNHFQIIYPTLLKNVDGNSPHWNAAVAQLSYHVVELYKDMMGLDTAAEEKKLKKDAGLQHKVRENKWVAIKAEYSKSHGTAK